MEFSNGVKKSSELLMVLLVVYTFITLWEPIDFFLSMDILKYTLSNLRFKSNC